MKIIKRWDPPPEMKYVIKCHNCQTAAIAERKEGRFVEDQRDGDAIVFQCPVCGKDCWVHYNRHHGGW